MTLEQEIDFLKNRLTAIDMDIARLGRSEARLLRRAAVVEALSQLAGGQNESTDDR
jgi:hypothetical protein